MNGDGFVEYIDRAEWRAECERRGLTIEIDRPYRDGMSTDDKYDAEIAYDSDGQPVGMGGWNESLHDDWWEGMIADDAETFGRVMNDTSTY